MDQAAVIAAGIHGAAFAGYIDQIRIRVGFFGVGVIRGDAARQHGVVVLLAEHIAHGIAGLGADQLALCQQGKKAAHIPRGNGTQLFAPVIAAQAAVQLGVGAANAADKRIDGIQPQIVDQHVGGNVVADNDHQGGNIAGAQPGTFA